MENIKGVKRKNRGITLIALVITIIILLILAGIAISQLTQNGILGKAQSASEEFKVQSQLERWSLLKNESIMKKNIDGNALDESYVRNELQEVDVIFTDTEWKAFVVGKSKVLNNNVEIYYSDLGENKSFLEDSVSVEPKVDESLELTSGKYVISDKLQLSNFSIEIPENQNVTLIVEDEVKIDDIANAKSPINISKNSTLDLYCNNKLNVYAGTNRDSLNATSGKNGKGGLGGCAGIHVPEGATLNIYGTGTVVAYGGDAGDGGNALGSNNNVNGGGRRRSRSRYRTEMAVMVEMLLEHHLLTVEMLKVVEQ